jgi:hypothetical protein
MFYVIFFAFCWCFHLIIMLVHCFVHCRLAFKSKVLKFKKFCFMLLEHAKICLCDTYHFKIGCKNWTNVFNAVLWKKICRKIVVIIDLFLHFSARIIFCCRSKQVSHFLYVNLKRLNKIKQNGIKLIFWRQLARLFGKFVTISLIGSTTYWQACTCSSLSPKYRLVKNII